MLTTLDLRKVRCIDGLHYSFQLLKLNYDSMWDLCSQIPADNGKAIAAMSACWGFVDALHRIREISQAVPGLSTKHPEMRIFLSETKLAETYRHYIQHVRGELSKSPPNTFPVWGSLSWVDPLDATSCHTAMLGAHIQGTNFTSCVYDTIENRWVSHVCLGIEGHSFNFDPIYRTTERFMAFVMPMLKNDASGTVKFHESLPIASASFQFIGEATSGSQ